jgi:thiol-disulfide isomerase/thioredoxin
MTELGNRDGEGVGRAADEILLLPVSTGFRRKYAARERNIMKRTRALVVGLAALSLLAIQVSGTLADTLKVAPGVLSRIEYPTPESTADRQYLGLPKQGSFRLPQIKADTVIVEIFSMYCPYCQAEAPKVNKLHSLIESNPALKGKIKIIGIGARNTPYEVRIFRKNYGIRFPLLPDEKFLTQKVSKKQIRTPTFIVLKKQGKSGLAVVDVKIGKFKSAEEFLKRISRK